MTDMAQTQDIINGLQLFKSLIKDGCEWHGDVMSRKWAEMLYIPNDVVMARVLITLAAYGDTDYRLHGYEVWIA
jgi:hypothetical protein